MNKKIIVSSAVILIIVIVGFVWWRGMPTPTQKYTGPVEKVTIAAIDGIEWGSPLYVAAQQQGYFVNNGLDVNFQYYVAGKLAIEALLGGKADLATVADAAFMPKTFDNLDLRVLATIEVTNDMVRLIARKDKGIVRPTDLKGKRIGVTRNTIAHFFLGDFLLNHRLSYADITIVDLLPPQVVEAITKGDVDAVSTWEPHAYNIVKTLGNNSVVWPEQVNQGSYFLIVGKEQWISAHQELVKRLLGALENGEVYLKENNKQAKELATKHFKVTEPYTDFVWPKIQFELTLPQVLLVALEDQARWAIQNKLTDKTVVPNYLNYIYFDALEKVKPQAINIVH